MSDLRAYMDFAVETAWLAGRQTLGYFQTDLKPDFKTDNSPVTIADREGEKLIRARIEAAFPDHAIVGEEFGEKSAENATHRWFVDPIDGTKSFVCGVPFYGVLIGLEINGRIEVGVAYFPGVDEMLAAATGEGCWWNGKRTHVRAAASLAEAVVCYTDSSSFDAFGRGEAWRRVCKSTRIQRGWGDAYGYLLVATGRAHIMLDPIMNAWDCGPFPVIFREAGGYCGDWQGNETIYAEELMACHPETFTALSALWTEQ